MLWTIGLILLAIGVFWVALDLFGCWYQWFIGNRGKLRDISAEISSAMKTGAARATLRIDHRKAGAGYIDFVKQIAAGGEKHFLMLISEEACAPGEFDKVRNTLDQMKIPYAMHGSNVGNQLVIDCDKDIPFATRACQAVLVQVWGATVDSVLRCRWKGTFYGPLFSEESWDEPPRLGGN